MNTLAEAAIDYAGRGMSVFPLYPRAKEPYGELVPNGHLNATAHIDRVRAWWDECPEANIGLRCAPDFLVLDEDPRHGGDMALEDLFMNAPRYGFETLTSDTGGGGRHFVFNHPPFDVSLKEIARGLDIKSKGYIVAPPSIHPISGKPYVWQDASAPITDIPDWLTQIIVQKAQGQNNGGMALSIPDAITEGRRNETLFKLACSLRSKGLSESAICAALLEENRIRCRPALPADEVRRIAASAGQRYEPGHSTPSMIGVNVASASNAAEALTLLNALPLWQGRLRWISVRRCGNTVICTTEGRQEVRFEQQYMLTFARCQTAIWASTGLVIPTPKRSEVKPLWEQAAELIGKVCMENYQERGGSEDDTRVDLLRTFRAACEPMPIERDHLFPLLLEIRTYRRDPHAETAPPAAFLWDGAAWVHPATLKVWLSTVPGGNRHVSVGEIREHLALLGFTKDSLEAEREGERVQVSLWRGPAAVLEEE